MFLGWSRITVGFLQGGCKFLQGSYRIAPGLLQGRSRAFFVKEFLCIHVAQKATFPIVSCCDMLASTLQDFPCPASAECLCGYVHLIECSRSPKELVDSLSEAATLNACLRTLMGAGHNDLVDKLPPHKPKWFVEPTLVHPIATQLGDIGVNIHGQIWKRGDLRSRHIIISDTYLCAVQDVICNMRKKLKVTIREHVIFRLRR